MKKGILPCMHLISTNNVCKLIFFVLSFANYSCNNRVNNQTKLFKKYMQKEFRVNLGTKKEFYFIVPSSGCIGCNKVVATRFSSDKKRENNCYIIITKKALKNLGNIQINNQNVFIDENNTIESLDIDLLNTSLIIWENDRIQKIEILTPENTFSIVFGLP